MDGATKEIATENNMENKNTKKAKCDFKRQRSENWSDADKELLKELIKNRVKEVENKNTDTYAYQTKKKAWIDLEKDFNSLCSCETRTISQLKSQWTTIKMNAKKEVSEFRAKCKQTGGGQAPPAVSLSGNDISVWLPNEFVVHSNHYDCDAVFDKDAVTISEECVLVQEACSENRHVSLKADEKELEADAKIEKITPHKRKIAQHKSSATEESIAKIAKIDIDCRQELHLLHIEAVHIIN